MWSICLVLLSQWWWPCRMSLGVFLPLQFFWKSLRWIGNSYSLNIWWSFLLKPSGLRLQHVGRFLNIVSTSLFVIGLFNSIAQSCLTLCNPMNRSTPGLPIHHQLPESTQTHIHRVGNAIQPSHPLSFPSRPAFNLSQHQGLFKWVSSSHQVAKVLEFQLQHQSFQWIFRIDFL